MRCDLLTSGFVLLVLSVSGVQSFSGEVLSPVHERFGVEREGTTQTEAPSFQRHVVPLLGHLGCNGRSCHGSFQGQGGFRLSLFGYDFAGDHQALTDSEASRVDIGDPPESLVLNMPTSEADHGGGQRFKAGGWEYWLLRSWIETGAEDDSDRTGKLIELEVTPREIIFERESQETQLRVVAHWSDGTREDVTCLTRFDTKNEVVAEVLPKGRVRAAGKGVTNIIASYDAGVVPVAVMLPASDLVGSRYPQVPTPTRIDKLVVAQLRKLGIEPSDRCSDPEFLRRASLDITGTLPRPDEVLAFEADRSSDKRQRKIEQLLERPAYVTWWTTRLCDLTGLNGNAQLGGTEMAKVAGELWHAWIERRLRDNDGYDDIVRRIMLATSRKPGETYGDYVEAITSYVRKRDRVDYAEQEMMQYYWFRKNLVRPQDKALAVAYAFLGVRLDCAQCHKHPFDQWSQKDFQQFTAFFDRIQVGYAQDAEKRRRKLEELVGLKDFKNAKDRRVTFRKLSERGSAIVPWRELYIAPPSDETDALPPKVLGGEDLTIGPDQDPREPLMNWLLEKDNPYFARALVNRVWAHYFGVGIVDPPDDFNLANPPSNPELLDYLADAFVEHGYDLKWLHREITGSRTYQLTWRPTETNKRDRRLFSHALPRRLPAEVVVDAIEQATVSDEAMANFQQQVRDRRIGLQPPAKARGLEYGLAVFGKPIREVNCDCERQLDPSLQQALYMRNDKDLWAMIDSADGWIAQINSQVQPDDIVRQAFLRTLSRMPDERELTRCREFLVAKQQIRDGARDLLWALLNMREFGTNH